MDRQIKSMDKKLLEVLHKRTITLQLIEQNTNDLRVKAWAKAALIAGPNSLQLAEMLVDLERE